jgi:lysophospholipase L1-like esterase
MARFLLWMMLALGVFGYGIGVGRYRWPPWNALAAGFHLVRPPPLEYSSYPFEYSSYQDARAEIYASSKARPDVVMLGDSLTEFGIWSEMLEDFSVVNRGISGDHSAGVLRRLPEVLGRKPGVICLEIGTNDLFKGVPTEHVIENVRAIAAAAVQAGSLVILQSVPFVVAGYRPNFNEAVKRLNAGLRDLTNGAQVRFFDLNTILADGEVLDPRNSYDGLHLNGRGYLIWTAALAPLLRDTLRWPRR